MVNITTPGDLPVQREIRTRCPDGAGRGPQQMHTEGCQGAGEATQGTMLGWNQAISQAFCPLFQILPAGSLRTFPYIVLLLPCLELVVEISRKPLTIRSLSRKVLPSWQPCDRILSPAWSWQPLLAPRCGPYGSTADAAWRRTALLSNPRHPGHGYTVAFKWQ